MKRFRNLIIALLLVCSFNSCAYDMYDYDYSYYTGDYNTVTIITMGTPVYIDGYVSYYFYNGYYWYPYYRGTTVYFHRRYRPLSMYAYRHSRFYHSRHYNNYHHDYYNGRGNHMDRNDHRRPSSSYRNDNTSGSTRMTTPSQKTRVRTQSSQQPRVTAPRTNSTPRVNSTPRTTPRVNVAPRTSSPSTRNSVPSTSRSTGTRRR